MANETKLAVKKEDATTRHPLETLRREFDRLFEGFGAGFPAFGKSRSLFDLEALRRAPAGFGAAPPAVDVVEKETEYAITAELPGIDEKDVEVSLADDVLTIKGEKREEKEEKNKDFYLAERSYGAFQRAFRLPDDVDAGKIAATFKNGVLAVTLPKAPAAQQKVQKIAVKAA